MKRPFGFAVVVVATALAAITSACSSPAPPPPSSAPAAPPPTTRTLPTAASIRIDRSDPVAVLVGMCDVVFTRDASTEGSYSDSYRRAEKLMTPELARELLAPTQSIRPFPQWVQWRAEQAWIDGDCTATADQHPADTDRTVTRVLVVRETVNTGDGDPDSDTSWAVFATAANSSTGWRVSRFSVQPN